MHEHSDTKRMEDRFAEFGARIDDLLDTAEHSELVSGLKSELAVWKEWIGEARVQSALGSMEARDRFEGALKSLEHAYSRMKARVEEIEQLPNPVPGLDDTVRHELDKVKEELMSPEAFAS